METTMKMEDANAVRCGDVGILNMISHPVAAVADKFRRRRLSRILPADRENGDGVQWHGTPGQWRIVFKAWSRAQHWMKTTKALALPGGVLVQVTTREDGCCAEALQFVPGVALADNEDGTVRFVPPTGPPETALTNEEIVSMASAVQVLTDSGRPRTAAILERALRRIRPGIFAPAGIDGEDDA